METSNLDAELKTLVIRMLKEPQQHKKMQSETKDTLIEIKNNLQGNTSMNKAENQVNDLENKKAKNNQSEQVGKRIQKNKIVTSSEDGGVGKYASPLCTAIAKIAPTLQNKCHPELSGN